MIINLIISVDEKRFDSDNRFEDYQAYENLVKETVDYESLEVTHHDDMRQVDEIVNLIVETVMCKNDKILIASNWYPASLVKKKFLMLTYPHIEYVLHCMTRISQQECRGILELREYTFSLGIEASVRRRIIMNISFYLIPKSEVTYIHQEDTVAQALRVIHKHGYQAVPVIDEKGRYVGTISEGDFLWNLIEEYHMDMEVMRKSHVKSMRLRWDYKPVSIDADIEQLDNHILNQNFVPVVDGRNVFIGIITRKEIIKELLKQKKDVLAKSSLAEQNVHNTQQAGRTFH